MKRLTRDTIRQYVKDRSLTAEWDEENRNQFVDELIRLINVCESGTWETAVLDNQRMGMIPKVTYCSHCNSVVALPTPYCPICGSHNGDCLNERR